MNLLKRESALDKQPLRKESQKVISSCRADKNAGVKGPLLECISRQDSFQALSLGAVMHLEPTLRREDITCQRCVACCPHRQKKQHSASHQRVLQSSREARLTGFFDSRQPDQMEPRESDHRAASKNLSLLFSFSLSWRYFTEKCTQRAQLSSVYSNVTTIYRQAYYMVLDTGYLLSSVSVYE